MTATERLYAPVDPPVVSPEERRLLLEGHERMEVGRFRADNGLLIEAKLLVPVCAKCGGEWGTAGCATVRALAALSWHESVAHRWRIRERTLEATLADKAVRTGVDALNGVLAASMVIDPEAVRVGGAGVLEAAASRLARELADAVWPLRVVDPPAVFR